MCVLILLLIIIMCNVCNINDNVMKENNEILMKY